MPQRKSSKGHCIFCQKEFSKVSITKHLATCAERTKAIERANAGKGTAEMLFHLRVQDAYRKEFWLDLEMRSTKSLKDLDTYLRGIWLECCGHLSEFLLGTGRFASQIGKQRKLQDVFQRTDTLSHIYDFGTSSETIVKLVAVREGKPLTSKPILLMARNQRPEATCIECDQPAEYLCQECLIEDEVWGTLCAEHVESHPHDGYGDPIPLVNSPRLGMCGYDGLADPPY
ncbi:hypothetical protein ACN4EG_23870 [Alkalinema pantanalense CENA528]|uniref:hypothetical protein n=1 Tax=Alkalinema pantanalense TaxID=1620705 RepID=UPI003D6F16ED